MLELREILWKKSTPIFPYDNIFKNGLDGQHLILVLEIKSNKYLNPIFSRLGLL